MPSSDAPSPGATLLDRMLEDMLRRRYLVVDGQGRISRWSTGAESLLGWREQEVMGRSAFGQPLAWAGEGVQLWKSYFEATQAARPPASAGLMMLCRDGWGRSVEMTAVPVPLVLGYEFTMLVADLAVGGPGSQSEDRLIQVHPLAADAIASALREDAPSLDSVAGLLLTLRAVSEAAVIEDSDAQHAARALAIERDDSPREAIAEELPPVTADDDSAEDLAEAHASLQAASTEVTRLQGEIGRLRSQLGEEHQASEHARAEAGRLSAALDQAGSETKLAAANAAGAQAALAGVTKDHDAARAALDEATTETESLRAEVEVGTRKCEELAAELEAKTADLEQSGRERDEARGALGDAMRDHDAAREALEHAASEHDATRAELDKALADQAQAAVRLEELGAERDRLQAGLDDAAAERNRVQGELDSAAAEQEGLTTALEEAAAERDELQRQLDDARAALGDAARERDNVGAVAGETEREREALRAELELAASRCEELSAALDAKTAELQGLPGKPAVESAKRDRDEARSALAAALAERDRAAGALDDAAGDRDTADAALRQAEAERDEARAALADAASESEAAHAAVAAHEERAEELRRRLEEAESAAAERAAEVEAATREAAEQRERVAAGHLETEALARERARVSELETQIASLTGELEGALARAAEHAPAETPRAREPAGAPRLRPFQAGLDDAELPRAYIGLDGRFSALNDGFSQLVGYSEAEFSGAYWPPVIDSENRKDLRRATARLIAGELNHCEVDTFYMAGNGTLVKVVGTMRVERDPAGSAQHLVLEALPLSAVAA